jgi:hypothetical protein
MSWSEKHIKDLQSRRVGEEISGLSANPDGAAKKDTGV